MSTVLFRCDGLRMLGHLSRSIGLAEALHEIGWRALFLSRVGDAGRGLLATAGFEHLTAAAVTPDSDAAHTATVARDLGADLVVLDGYDFTSAFAERIGAARARLAVIDDFASWHHYPVDIVLNCDIGAPALRYPPGGARLLLGPQYFLARANLRRRRAWPRASMSSNRLYIAFSGDGDGTRTLAALRGLADSALHVRALVANGPGRRPVEDLLSAFGSESCARPIPHDLSEDLAWADAALCTGGMIKYEALFLGAFPLTVANTPAEAADTGHWLDLGVGLDLGQMSDFSENTAAGGMKTFMGLGLESRQRAMERAWALFTPDPTAAAARAVAGS